MIRATAPRGPPTQAWTALQSTDRQLQVTTRLKSHSHHHYGAVHGRACVRHHTLRTGISESAYTAPLLRGWHAKLSIKSMWRKTRSQHQTIGCCNKDSQAHGPDALKQLAWLRTTPTACRQLMSHAQSKNRLAVCEPSYSKFVSKEVINSTPMQLLSLPHVMLTPQLVLTPQVILPAAVRQRACNHAAARLLRLQSGASTAAHAPHTVLTMLLPLIIRSISEQLRRQRFSANTSISTVHRRPQRTLGHWSPHSWPGHGQPHSTAAAHMLCSPLRSNTAHNNR